MLARICLCQVSLVHVALSQVRSATADNTLHHGGSCLGRILVEQAPRPGGSHYQNIELWKVVKEISQHQENNFLREYQNS
jgi:hypothetical protein